MLRYLLQLKRAGRSVIDPIPVEFGAMYFLYPEESGHIKGFRATGWGEKLAAGIRAFFRHDETLAYRPEKIY